MPTEPDSPSARIRRIARRQADAIARRQILLAGMSRGQLERQVDGGFLFRHHRGVYLLLPPQDAPPATLLSAAGLACGEGSQVSHRAAGEHWSFLAQRPGLPIDVSVPTRPGGDLPGIRRHFRPDLGPGRIWRGVSVTTPAQTILDLSASLDEEEILQVISQARVQRLVSPADLRRLCEVSRSRGVRRLRRLLVVEHGHEMTRSRVEALMGQLVRQARLPKPETNAMLEGGERDLIWRRERLVLEIDGFAFHGDRASFENDRRRDAQLIAAGYRVIRVTWRQIRDEPLWVIATIARALGPG